MPIRNLSPVFGWLGLLLVVLSLVAGCGATAPTAPAESAAEQTEPTVPPASTPPPSLGDRRTRPSDGMVRVFVPGGSFEMGSTEAEVADAIALCREHYRPCNGWFYERQFPQHPVTLAGYWLDQHEVTNAQYRQCVEAGVCEEPSTCKKGTPTYADPDKADHPVVCVTWQDAGAYCGWAGARLPTEAEWEYAFRGEERHLYPWGDEFEGARLNYCDTSCTANHADERYDDGYVQTSPVVAFAQGASWSGALGMGGNVSEWVSDWLSPYGPEAESNPTGPSEGAQKMVKGGSWFFHPTYCRGASRASVDPGTRFDYLGFRCAASLVEQ